MRFSILDRANAVDGWDATDVFQGVIDHARFVEELGFERFLVAEHHAIPGIPGSQPAILASAVAGGTSTIRVGTGGIMLPDHQPIVVAEQIGMLSALHPGRIDIGIGSSVGFTEPIRRALRQEDVMAVKERFRDDLNELLGFLDGTAPVTAQPFNDARTPLWLLANFRSLLIAAELGLGVIVGGPSLTDHSKDVHEGLSLYRSQFRPCRFGAEPRAIVAINVAVAESRAAARRLLLPQLWAEVRSRSTGSFEALQPAHELDEATLSAREQQRLQELLDLSIFGTPREVNAELEALRRFTGVDEILITGGMSDVQGQRHSEQLLADLISG